MKKITMSLAATAILASGAYAGTVSGEISAYTTGQSEAEQGYTLGSVSLNYETEVVKGFKGSLGFISNSELDEQTEGSYGENESSAVMTTANVSYDTDAFTVIVGKQAIDLEWISDYHEAVVGVLKVVPNLTLIAGHTSKINTSANDEALVDWAQINGKEGASVVDASYAIGEVATVGAYYMTSKDLFDAYGAKVEASVADLGITAKYAATSEGDLGAADDGNIMALDLSYSMEPMSFGLGYIQTDKDGGTGSISALGDNINPLDTGNQVYGTDASTLYASVGATVAGFELGALYGTTEYGDYTESELNLSASWECKLLKNLNLSALYVDIAADGDDATSADESYYAVQAAYSF